MGSWLSAVLPMLRAWRSHPASQALLVASLCLGCLMLLTVTAAVSGFLWRPLAIADADQVVRVREVQAADSGERDVFSVAPATWRLWREQLPASLVDLAAATGQSVAVRSGEYPEQRQAALISANFFSVLGLRPLLGRDFDEEVDRRQPDQVIIGERYWREQLGADPAVLGRSLSIDGQPHAVIGVMPSGLSHPYDAEIWLPIALRERLHTRVGNYLYVPARLKPGVTMATAEAELGALSERLHRQYPDLVDAVAVTMRPIRAELLGDLLPALRTLGLASLLIFAVAVLNSAALCGIRAWHARSRAAIQVALGAGAAQLGRQALACHLGNALIAVLLALALMGLLGQTLLGLAGSSSITEFDVGLRVDGLTLLAAGAVLLLITVLLTLTERRVLAAVLRRPRLAADLRQTASRKTASRLRLVAAVQLAAGLVVLVAALLVTEGFLAQVAGERGYEAEKLWLIDVPLPSTRHADTAAKLAYVDAALAAIRAVPGVALASAATVTPDEGGSWGAAYQIPGQDPPPLGYHLTNHRLVMPGYFQALGLPLLQGRDLQPADYANPGQPAVNVVISRELAQAHWPGLDPIGRQLQRHQRDQLLTVVGVVGDVREAERARDWDATTAWYLPAAAGTDYDFRQVTLALRLAADANVVMPAVREALRRVDPQAVQVDVASMRARLEQTFAHARYSSRLFLLFAALALLVAGTGSYALLAFVCATREREFGLRLALGATPRHIAARLWLDGARTLSLALLLGLPLAWLAGQLMVRQLSELPVPDWHLYLIAMLCCTLAQAMALWRPARRAAQADPNRLIRSGA